MALAIPVAWPLYCQQSHQANRESALSTENIGSSGGARVLYKIAPDLGGNLRPGAAASRLAAGTAAEQGDLPAGIGGYFLHPNHRLKALAWMWERRPPGTLTERPGRSRSVRQRSLVEPKGSSCAAKNGRLGCEDAKGP